MSKINLENQPLPFGLKMSYMDVDKDKWVVLTQEEIEHIKIKDLLDGTFRIAAQLTVDGKSAYITTHREDAVALKKKYPRAIVACAAQVANLFAGNLNEDVILYRLPKILPIVSEFGAQVVKSSNREFVWN